MKKLSTLIGATLLAVAVTNAQTDTNLPVVNVPPVATNGVTPGFLTDVLTFFSQGTNFIVVPYGIVTAGNNNKYGGGGGLALAYEVSQYFNSGMRIEYLNKAFYQGSFTTQLQVPIKLFNKVTVVPFILGGVAVPFGGGTENNAGTVQGIAGTGLAIRLSSRWDILGDIEKWSATPGRQYRFGFGYKF